MKYVLQNTVKLTMLTFTRPLLPAVLKSQYGFRSSTSLLFLLLLLSLPARISGQALPISIDGEFDDWDDAALLYDYEENGDKLPDELLSVKRIHAANDQDFLFLRFEFDREIKHQEANSIELYLDTDNDISTGYQPDVLGAELRWELGERRGQFYRNGSEHFIRFNDIRLRSAPTVSSTEFEFAIGRHVEPDGTHSLFKSDRVRIFLRTEADAEVIAADPYDFSEDEVPDPEPIPIDRRDPSDLRVTAFNAWDDKLFETEFTEQYERILSALQPDIIAFQEIWDHDAEETVQRMEELLPGKDANHWHGAKMDNGNVTVSRFPVIDSWRVYDNGRLTAVLLDANEAYDTELLVINVHLRCCSRGENNRWNEIQALSDFIEDSMEEGGRLHIEEDTPIIVAGDFNLVGSRDQLEAIQAGITEWHGKYIKPVMPRQTEKRMNYTWRNDQSTFMPGKLDYIFYSGSMLTLKNNFTLQVESMSPEQRDIYDLQYGDTRDASDHLPLTADFGFQDDTGSAQHEVPGETTLLQNYPNPFNPVTIISYEIPDNNTEVSLDIFSVDGRHISTLVNETQNAGQHHIEFDASDLPSGIYIYQLSAGDITESRMMTFIK